MRERPRDVVALVGSAGAIAAMVDVLGTLPADLDAAVVVLLHLMPDHPSLLAQILARKTELQVREAQEGDALEAGTVYVAPPDLHLLVTAQGMLHLESSPRVHHVRPSADTLLLSLAQAYGKRCFAAVLSGSGSDGADGTLAVHEAGGHVVAQDEATSAHFGMPSAAILAGGVDQVLALEDIGPAVVDFAGARAA